ncbi:MAG: GTP cyclohydrolase I FolE [Bacteroidia bacterium]|nr:GTP cyclohydrolase I FolE [Bacteroidia bacterium]
MSAILSEKQKEILLEELENLNDEHFSGNPQTPLRPDAFELSDEEKIHLIRKHIESVLHILGMDLNDDSLKDTPLRVAKMFVKEFFYGLNPENKPKVKLFKNTYKYGEMLIEKNISFYSVCEHHLVPIVGKAHVAYISSGKVIGLSKLNRIVQYYASRPQVQERMTMQIGNEFKDLLKTEDVAVILDAKHLCVSMRGIKDDTSSTVTSFFSGKFKEDKTRKEFLKLSGY